MRTRHFKGLHHTDVTSPPALQPALVQRPALQTNNWVPNADGDWSVASNWSLGTVPDSNSKVVISTASVHTIAHSTGNDTVYSLSVGQDFFDLTGGSLGVLTTATFADGFTQTGGQFTAGTVSITGAGTLTGGSATGSTILAITGNIALANYTLAGSAVLQNAHVTNETGQVVLGDNTGVNATIDNATGGTYSIAGDYGISQGAASAVFDNAGVLTKAAGNGTSDIGVTTDSTGTLSAVSGNLEFDGPSNVIGGVLTGAGEISFGGGGNTSLTLGTATLGALGLFGSATLNLAGGAARLNGALNDYSSGTNLLNIGSKGLQVHGNANFVGAYGTADITGSSTLSLYGTSTAAVTDFGGSVTVANDGVFNETGAVTLGNGSGGTVTLRNVAAHSYNLTTDDGVYNGGQTPSGIVNLGTFAKTGGSGTSTISVAFSNNTSASLNAADGTILFSNTLANSGTISGTGQVAITGSATFSSGTALSVAQLDLYGSCALTLGTSLSYGGVFADDSNGNNSVNLGGNTLTLTGGSNSVFGAYGSAYITGSGTLVNAASGTLGIGNAVIGGTALLNNKGAVVQSNTVTIGDGSGALAGIANAGIWSIASDDNVGEGANGMAGIVNTGTFGKTGGGGTSTVGVVFTNQTGGTISAATGTLLFNDSLSNAGTITGAGQVAITGSATFSAGTVLNVAQLDLYSASSLTLGLSLSYGGVFADDSNGSNSLNLGANSLTLTGSGNSIVGAFGTAYVGGSGSLVNAAGGTLTVSAAQIGGSDVLTNNGMVNQTGVFTIGDGSGKVAGVSNKATWTIANDTSLNEGAALTSYFSNGDLVDVTAGAGVATINTLFENGAGANVDIVSGSLDNAGILSNSGTISGTDLQLVGSSQTTLASGTKLSVSSLEMYSTSTLNLAATQSFAGTFNDYSNGSDTINLNKYNLNLTGKAYFIGAFGSDVVTGSGTLTIHAATSLANVLIGGTATFDNATTIQATGGLQIGDGSANAATFLNAAKGIYDIVADNANLGHGASGLSDFLNDGLFEKTSGTGTTTIGVDFVNNGTITVTSGTLEFYAGYLSGSGVINGTVTHDQQGDTFITAN